MVSERREGYDHPRFKGFTEASIEVLRATQTEAKTRRAKHIGTEHILLALINYPTCIAYRLIAEKTDIGEVRSSVEFVIGGNEKTDSNIELRLTPKAKNVIEQAVAEARDSNTYVDTQHLLFGIMEKDEGFMSSLLESFGITKKDLPELRERAKQLSNQRSADWLTMSPAEQQKEIDTAMLGLKSVFDDKDIVPEYKKRLFEAIKSMTQTVKDTKRK